MLRAAALVALLASAAQAQSGAIVITNVTVIDATGRPPAPGRTLVIDSGRIRSIGPTRQGAALPNARVINGSGKFLIPGLWDMHIHFRGGAELVPDNESWLSVFLAHGVTGVREMGGDIPEAVFRWRAEIASGKRLGPRILTSGPKLDGPKPIWPGSIGLTDPASAAAAVAKLKAMGADFVKNYATDYPPAVFAAVVRESKRQGLATGGHSPFLTHTTREVIDSGVRFIEHAQYYVLGGCSPEEKRINGEFLARQGTKRPMGYIELAYRYAQSCDAALAEDIVRRLARRGVWVTPTLAVGRQRESAGRVDHESHPQRKLTPPGIWKSWDLATGRRKGYTGEEVQQLAVIQRKTGELVKLMQARGVGLLAGSDSGASNNYTYAGWTLHRELALLVESGLTPMEALQAATRNPARFLGEQGRAGTVEKGKIADLVLLNADPLADIANVADIDSVIVKGKLLARADLERLLEASPAK